MVEATAWVKARARATNRAAPWVEVWAAAKVWVKATVAATDKAWANTAVATIAVATCGTMPWAKVAVWDSNRARVAEMVTRMAGRARIPARFPATR